MKVLQFLLVFILGVVVGYLLSFLPRPAALEGISGVEYTDGGIDIGEQESSEESSSDGSGGYEIREPIPLRNLPLSDAQKRTAATFGIDVETFVITPAMLDCAEGKLGTARLEAIIGGSSLTYTESFSLMGCL